LISARAREQPGGSGKRLSKRAGTGKGPLAWEGGVVYSNAIYREPRVGHLAKIFWSGRSQAVRLPKEFRFEGEQVRIRREGDKVILEPVEDDGAWIDRIFGAFDEEFARAVLDGRPGPNDYERPDISFD
jgi:antitoxin VapB